MHPIRFILVGLALVLFAILLPLLIDEERPDDKSITQIAGIVVGSFFVLFGILRWTGVSRRDLNAPITHMFPENRNARFFTGSQLAFGIAVIAVYVVVAEFVDFYLMGLPSPRGNPIAHRVAETAIVWAALWVVVGWWFFVRGYVFRWSWHAWLMLLIPLLAGLVEAGDEFAGQRARAAGPPAPPSTVLRLVESSLLLIPLVKGLVLAAILYVHLRVWAKRTEQGCCANCGYNLRGNESGVCPECGVVAQAMQQHGFEAR